MHEDQTTRPLVPAEPFYKQHEQKHGQKKFKSDNQGKLSKNFANLTGDLTAAADTGDTTQYSARIWLLKQQPMNCWAAMEKKGEPERIKP